jgi:hypothetical protein
MGLLALTASPAGADPAGPSDYRSEVTGIVPAVKGVHAEIRGGDSFLEVSVERGHEVVVSGYTGEPYLRIEADGTIERNRLSSATYLNNDRKGRVTVPDRVTKALAEGAEPDWERIGDGGTYAWHDHRVHWMSDASPSVSRGERVKGDYDPWKVPIEVDGTAAVVQGTLTYAAATSPLPWAALALGALVALAWWGRGRGLHVPAAVLAVVSVAAVVVGRADWASTPGGGNPLLWALAAVALVTALGAVALAQRSVGVVLALASVASLSGWALLRFQVLVKPILPTDLPFALDRATVALALAVSAAAAYLAVTSGVLALPDLDDD